MKIIEQGFVCTDDKYYLIGTIIKNTKEPIPVVATKGKQKRFCALVTKLDSMNTSYKYLTVAKLPSEVVQYLKDNNYKIKEND